MSRCRGILGIVLGHQYVKHIGGWVYESSFCFRCGMQGGWKPAPKYPETGTTFQKKESYEGELWTPEEEMPR